MTFGQVKFYAYRLLAGEGVPLFMDRATNYAIEAHVSRIERARTRRRAR